MTKPKYKEFYGAVRVSLGPKRGERPRASVKRQLRRSGLRVVQYARYAYVQTKKGKKCGAAKKATARLKSALRKLELRGDVGLMATTVRPRRRWSGGRWVPRSGSASHPSNEVRLRKCPR